MPRKTQGKSMIIIGAAMNHWYHMDMNYRGVINMLVMCGCVGQSGGGWAHYVGQEKLRPQTGWLPLGLRAGLGPTASAHEFDLDAWYAHTDQWRYETLTADEILSPTAPGGRLGHQPDRLQHPRRADGLVALCAAVENQPFGGGESGEGGGQGSPGLCRRAADFGRSGNVLSRTRMPRENWPRNLFVWRSNLLGSSGKGHEYFLKHLLGTDDMV